MRLQASHTVVVDEAAANIDGNRANNDILCLIDIDRVPTHLHTTSTPVIGTTVWFTEQ